MEEEIILLKRLLKVAKNIEAELKEINRKLEKHYTLRTHSDHREF